MWLYDRELVVKSSFYPLTKAELVKIVSRKIVHHLAKSVYYGSMRPVSTLWRGFSNLISIHMNRTSFLVKGYAVALILFVSAEMMMAQHSSTMQNLETNGVAAKGYDVVSYVEQNQATKGSESISATHAGAKYYFVSVAHKNKFLAKPQAYLPQYGGWCAWAVAEKEAKVDIDPTSFKVTDGKLFLFYKGVIGDVKPLWIKDEAALYKKAEANWPAVSSK